MPNRILRDWTDSETIDELDVHTERFFTRLIMKVDDFGRYSANVKLLKSNLFPLKSDIRETDITRWITACEKSGLIATYNVALKSYLQISNFKQVLRQKVEKYPSPVGCIKDDTQMPSGCLADASLKGNELEDEENTKGVDPPTHTDEQIELFKKFQEFIKNDATNVGTMKQPFTIDEFLKLKESFNVKFIKEMILKMHNYKPLTKNNVSAYLTFLNWSKKDFHQVETKPLNTITPTEARALELLKIVK